MADTNQLASHDESPDDDNLSPDEIVARLAAEIPGMIEGAKLARDGYLTIMAALRNTANALPPGHAHLHRALLRTRDQVEALWAGSRRTLTELHRLEQATHHPDAP